MTGDLGGLASGVFVTEDGWILTNKHVVEDFSRMFKNITVFPTKNEKADEECSFSVDGNNIVASEYDDIALIIPPEPWRLKCKPFTFITSTNTLPPTGTTISAIGFPGTDIGSDSVAVTSGTTAGIVRTTPPLNREELQKYVERILFMKMDIQIGPGNSGGPVIDDQGHLVGISTAMTQIKHYDGSIQSFVGLAVPTANVVNEFPELPSTEYVAEAKLTDVSDHAWFSSATQSFLAAGYFRNIGGLFRPGDNATRAEFIELIVDLLGGTRDSYDEETFTDVSPRRTYYRHFEEAAILGLVKGAGDCVGKTPCYANPEAPINRAEAATLLLRAFNLERTLDTPTFADAPDGEWYTESIEAAASLCILRGDDGAGTVRPADRMNRAEMIVMLERLHQNMTYPQCSSTNTDISLPPFPTEGADEEVHVGSTPCTQGSWACLIQSTCGREMEQIQTCTLIDRMCSNAQRAKPPEKRGCFPAEKKVREMIDNINESEELLNTMGTIVLELSDQTALRAIEIRKRYEAKLAEYKDFFAGAMKYSNYIALKLDEIEVVERALESIENEFGGLPGVDLKQ